jgi:CBS domain-containing protein
VSVIWEPRTVGELMTVDPIVATAEMPLAEAAQLMDFYRVSGLPVVDWSGAVVGLISQIDLLHARTTESLWSAWPGLSVKHLMTSPAVSVSAGTTVDDAARLMEQQRIHRLVVVGADGERPIGVLSLTDLVHAMAERGDA